MFPQCVCVCVCVCAAFMQRFEGATGTNTTGDEKKKKGPGNRSHKAGFWSDKPKDYSCCTLQMLAVKCGFAAAHLGFYEREVSTYSEYKGTKLFKQCHDLFQKSNYVH